MTRINDSFPHWFNANYKSFGSRVAELAQRYYAATASSGWGGRYFPAVIEVVDRNIDPAPARTAKD